MKTVAGLQVLHYAPVVASTVVRAVIVLPQNEAVDEQPEPKEEDGHSPRNMTRLPPSRQPLRQECRRHEHGQNDGQHDQPLERVERAHHGVVLPRIHRGQTKHLIMKVREHVKHLRKERVEQPGRTEGVAVDVVAEDVVVGAIFEGEGERVRPRLLRDGVEERVIVFQHLETDLAGKQKLG